MADLTNIVKPLVFEGHDGFWRADDGLGGFYEVAEINGEFHMCRIVRGLGNCLIPYNSQDAAYTAANVEHQRRILAAIDAKAVDALQRTIAARDRRIARLVEALNDARAKGYVTQAEQEPPVVLSAPAQPAPDAPAEDAASKGETAGEMLNRLGMDGAKWAAEFRTTALRLGYSDMDEGWLIGWFCNAIMAGYDRAPAQPAPSEWNAAIEAAADLANTTFSGSGTDAARIIRMSILALKRGGE